MSTIKIVLALSLLMLNTITARAQYVEGYLITVQGDTVRGYVRAPTASTMAQAIIFRQQITIETPQIRYPLKQLKGVELLGNKTYVIQKLQPILGKDTLRVLFQPLTIKGPIHLFRLDYNVRVSDASALGGSSYENVFYYIKQGQGPPIELTSKSFRPLFKQLFQNCPSLAATGRFDQANLIYLVNSYNACISVDATSSRP
ncbi:hypothetical protein [Hymenobacter sp. BT190]|uniref:hypothetical protein n=1 Tax=Hymenobacter sp. BT190 TaxID=2763505 RepID=UPI00165150E4|nr:hypothetical protein [Hymenobacter sp. BT190]MBC6697492.1 hypothetical protein [Hymenobacter sp. BT190]